MARSSATSNSGSGDRTERTTTDKQVHMAEVAVAWCLVCMPTLGCACWRERTRLLQHYYLFVHRHTVHFINIPSAQCQLRCLPPTHPPRNVPATTDDRPAYSCHTALSSATAARPGQAGPIAQHATIAPHSRPPANTPIVRLPSVEPNTRRRRRRRRLANDTEILNLHIQTINLFRIFETRQQNHVPGICWY